MQSISHWQSDDDWDNKYSLLCFLFSWLMNDVFVAQRRVFVLSPCRVLCYVFCSFHTFWTDENVATVTLKTLWQLTRWETALRHHLMTTFPSCVTLMCLTMANLTRIMFHRLLRTRYQSMDQSLYLIDAGRQAEWVCVVMNNGCLKSQPTPPTIISSLYQLNKQAEQSGEFINIKWMFTHVWTSFECSSKLKWKLLELDITVAHSGTPLTGTGY